MKEWRDIQWKKGYQVSDAGDVRSFVNNRHGLCDTPHPITPHLNKGGYPVVSLGKNCKKLVSRLTAEAFIPNPDNLPMVRHMDDNPQNNHVSNLRWGTQKDNMQDCVKYGRLVGDTSAAINAKKRRVVAISKTDGTRIMFESINEAARRLDLWPQHICSVLQGKISQTGGWKFIDIGEDDNELFY